MISSEWCSSTLFKPPFLVEEGSDSFYVKDSSGMQIVRTPFHKVASFLADHANFNSMHSDWGYKSND